MLRELETALLDKARENARADSDQGIGEIIVSAV